MLWSSQWSVFVIKELEHLSCVRVSSEKALQEKVGHDAA